LGRVFCRTYISELIGPGGVGKTATRAAQYLSLTSGRSPTGEKIWKRCRVLAISLEDNAAEANRRFTAAMIHHDVTKAEVGGWLFVSAPGARVGKLLALDKKGRSFRDILADVIEDAIKRIKPDLAGLDPLAKAIGVSENDNVLVDMAIQILTDFADRYDIAIDLLHHVRKGAPDPGNADTARGASANVNAGRHVYTLTTMSSEEAERFGVAEDNRRAYVRMDSAKVNITRSTGQAKWFHLVGVQIGNQTIEYPDGDEVAGGRTVEAAGSVRRARHRDLQSHPRRDRRRLV
jgi:RecA-family ATPase